MTIKAGERIADIDESWSGKVRYKKTIRENKYVIIDFPNGHIKLIYFRDVKYNNELGCFIHAKKSD
jgi:hypothetical protein